MRMLLQRFARDERGATTVVYGLIAAAMSIAIITAVSGLGSKLHATFAWVQTTLE
ncbi:MAG TPA: Flp family type IVb pilin [Xanthobacteraceae bacterium]